MTDKPPSPPQPLRRSSRQELVVGAVLSLLGTIWCLQYAGHTLSTLFVWAQTLAMAACALSMLKLDPIGGDQVRRDYQLLRGVLFLSLLALSATETTRFDRFDYADEGFGALWVLGAALLTWSGLGSLQRAPLPLEPASGQGAPRQEPSL